MAKISLNCDFRSGDNKQIFQTTGTKEDTTITFQDPNQETHILHLGTPIQYQKQGEAVLNFTFDPNNQTVGTYTIMGQVLEFTIDTTHCVQQDGMIRIQYTLYQHNEPVGNTTLAIDYRRNKEE